MRARPPETIILGGAVNENFALANQRHYGISVRYTVKLLIRPYTSIFDFRRKLSQNADKKCTIRLPVAGK